MRLVFLLSGEHRELPSAEVMAALQAEGVAARVLERWDQVLVVEAENPDPFVLASRLGMSHEVWMHLCTAPAGELLEAVSSTDVVDLLPHGKSLAVRVRRVKGASPQLRSEGLARQLAELIGREVKFKVDLKRPEKEVGVVLTEGVGVVGIKLANTARGEMWRRRPKHRKAFHPSTLSPSLARCLVNLARAPRHGTLLDPFCGVGGILIEAGLMGMRVIGVDLNPEMVEKARLNLESYGIKEFRVEVGDACQWRGEKVEAVATDPPYGRQASTGGKKLEELYPMALQAMADVLKRGRYLCLTSPSHLELGEMALKAGLKEKERYEQRVHRSLTRRIYVFRR